MDHAHWVTRPRTKGSMLIERWISISQNRQPFSLQSLSLLTAAQPPKSSSLVNRTIIPKRKAADSQISNLQRVYLINFAFMPTTHLTKSQSPSNPTQSQTTIPVLQSPSLTSFPSSVTICCLHRCSTHAGLTLAAIFSGQVPTFQKLLALRKFTYSGIRLPCPCAAWIAPGSKLQQPLLSICAFAYSIFWSMLAGSIT